MRFKLLLLLLLPILAHSRAGYNEPWGTDADMVHFDPTQAPPPPPQAQSLLVIAAEKVIRFHQNVLSPVDGPRSHFRPSSSQYMLLAMRKHGFIQGFFLGCDRLLRENSDAWVYRTIEEGGTVYKYDPVP